MTKIIGILNLTLDSFSDGGKYYDRDSAKKHQALHFGNTNMNLQ